MAELEDFELEGFEKIINQGLLNLYRKQDFYDALWNYYEGNHPLIYSSDKLRKIFKKVKSKFIQNWMGIITDAVNDRIELSMASINGDDEKTKTLKKIWDSNDMGIESDSAHLCALVTGESFIFVEEDEENKINIFYNDSRLVHAEYQSNNPRKLFYVIKWWKEVNGFIRLNLYMEDVIIKLISTREYKNEKINQLKFGDFMLLNEPIENDGIIPVFHFRRDPRKISGEFEGFITEQDAINKLFCDMIVAAEFSAFRQRVIISDIDDSYVSQLLNSPSFNWSLPTGSDVKELGVSDLDNYHNAIDKIANHIAIASRTPKHYLLQQGGAPSGESLIAMEAPLNKKAQRYIERFTVTWKNIVEYIFILKKDSVEKENIDIQFESVETVQPKTRSEIRKINTDTGIPLITSLKMEGWSQSDIDEMMKDKVMERESEKAVFENVLLDSLNRFDSGEL